MTLLKISFDKFLISKNYKSQQIPQSIAQRYISEIENVGHDRKNIDKALDVQRTILLLPDCKTISKKVSRILEMRHINHTLLIGKFLEEVLQLISEPSTFDIDSFLEGKDGDAYFFHFLLKEDSKDKLESLRCSKCREKFDELGYAIWEGKKRLFVVRIEK
jgi:hypothetical protein